MKVIISTFGPLHLMKSAESLTKYTEVKIIQGWIPKWWNKWLIPLVSYVIGRDIRKSFRKRIPSGVASNISLGIPEFLRWIINLLRIGDMLKMPYYANYCYGFMSRLYISDADIFHVRSGSGGGGAIEKAKKEGMKVVVDHSIAHPAFMEKQLRPEYNKNGVLFDLGTNSTVWENIIKDCYKADVLLVNSRFVKDTFIEQGYPENKIRIVYLGVRNDFMGIKKNYSISRSTKVLFTGGFNFRKGAEYILQAMSLLEKDDFPFEMTVVGDYSSAESLLNTYNIKHINLIGTVPQEDLKSYLMSSDLYLFPSLAEGCASSGMEAMAAGLPVITTRESGLPIVHEETGYMVPVKDAYSIAEAIKQLTNNLELREKLGRNANKLICTEYTWDKYALNVFSIYKELQKDEND